jgi:DNA repair exonuclease SbcCD nuclease subunit
MKILHTADHHLGYRQYGFKEREEDFLLALEFVFMRAKQLKVDVVSLGGDIFDTPKPPANTVRRVAEMVADAKGHELKVVGIDGNHDLCDSDWLRVCGIEPLSSTPMTIGDVKVVGINAMRATPFHAAIDALPSGADVLLIHQALAEFADFEASSITALDLAAKLKPKGIRLVLMGDIHDYKELEVGGVRFIYPGSTEINAIDEEHDKCCTYAEVTKDAVKTAIEPVPTRPMIEVHLDTEKHLDNLLVQLVPDDVTARTPLAVVWYNPENRELAKRAEVILKDKQILHRICPLSKGAEGTLAQQLARQGFERGGALQNLQGAIKTYFDEDSDPYQLVIQLLESPDSIQETVTRFMKSKGLD